MQIGWNDHQEHLKSHFGAIAASKIAVRAQELSRANQFDRESWELIVKQGLWEMILPERYSGRQPAWWDFTAALEGIAENCADGGFLLSLIAQAGIIHGLSQAGSESQQEKYFPMLKEGALTATCIAERHSGSDTGNLKTAAHPSVGQWLLNGDKWNIAHAPTADLLFVMGRLPHLGKRDITLFVLDPSHHDFIRRSKPDQKHGNRTIPTGSLEFEDLPLSEENVLGAPGQGIRALMHIVGIDRVYYGWMGAALLTPLLNQALDFIQHRESGRRPLADHQYVQAKIVETIIGLEQSRWVGMGTLAQMLNNSPGAIRNGSIAKLTGVRALEKGTRELLSLLGSEGYQKGLATHLIQDALGFISVGGTEEMHRINIFRQHLKLFSK